MSLTRKALFALPALGLATCLSHTVAAGTIYDFNSAGDTEGWGVILNSSPLVADGDSLNGTATNNDPQLTSGTVSLTTTEGWDTFVFRIREVDDVSGTVNAFNPIGLIVTAGGSTFNSGFTGVDSGDGFFTVTLDISSLGTSSITSIRLDPIGGAASNSGTETSNNTFEIDYIQVNDVPEPSSLALLGLGGLAMLRRRR